MKPTGLTIGLTLISSLMSSGLMSGLALTYSTPAQAQAEPSSQLSQSDTQPELDQNPPPSDLIEPLSIDQQQSDQFFQPAPRPQTIESQAGPNIDTENLLGPPPGTQTSGELTPDRQLSIPIR